VKNVATRQSGGVYVGTVVSLSVAGVGITYANASQDIQKPNAWIFSNSGDWATDGLTDFVKETNSNHCLYSKNTPIMVDEPHTSYRGQHGRSRRRGASRANAATSKETS
jgi:hypothetical protein